MTAKRVPSKIVIAGNSKMSLNERFSSIPKPRPRAAVMKAQHVPQMRNVHQRQCEEQIEYVPKAFVRRPRPSIQQRAVPFQSRVTFVNTVPVQRFPPRNNYVQKNHSQFQNNFRRPFRPNFNNQNQNRKFIHHNNYNNRFNHQNSGFQGGRKSFPIQPKKKSLAELDRELEDYMRKPKHTPITI